MDGDDLVQWMELFLFSLWICILDFCTCHFVLSLQQSCIDNLCLLQETTVGVERWVGGVLLLLRALITHSTSELILARLEELGLSMDYVHTDSIPDTTSSPSYTTCTTATTTTTTVLATSHYQGPQRPASLPLPVSETSASFRDPLNVTQPETLPQVAMARWAPVKASAKIIVENSKW